MFRTADAGLKTMCKLRVLRGANFSEYRTKVIDCHSAIAGVEVVQGGT